ncbi:hypothetical protein L873DRAFT_1789557 [Choiromyces venosus 120613-1]|uniref:Uncharacterized protein n=1 Tax=Choiromyces venosus 120613-1 TaxID=1336337 RepID=A0A3N4JN10_9PEZI|nr:hypothetical protein L873DRAFT_1789557 [Choiromyces venosus 120613-1]
MARSLTMGLKKNFNQKRVDEDDLIFSQIKNGVNVCHLYALPFQKKELENYKDMDVIFNAIIVTSRNATIIEQYILNGTGDLMLEVGSGLGSGRNLNGNPTILESWGFLDEIIQGGESNEGVISEVQNSITYTEVLVDISSIAIILAIQTATTLHTPHTPLFQYCKWKTMTDIFNRSGQAIAEASKNVGTIMSEVIWNSSIAKCTDKKQADLVMQLEETLTSLDTLLCKSDIRSEYKVYVKATHHLLKLYHGSDISLE